MLDLDVLQSDAASLEPLPQSATKLAALLAHDDFDLTDVCATVKLDEALTGRLLGVANSARSGARGSIGSVDAAVMRLGSGAVLGIALGAAVREELDSALPAYALEEGELWRHSVAAALAIEEAARFCRRRVPIEAFATALLHDVGKLILSRNLTEEILELIRAVDGGNERFTAHAEETVLGVDHGVLGAMVVRAWGLPERIAEAIEHHERPHQAPSDEGRQLAMFVALADAAAVAAGAACGGPEPPPEFTPEHAGALGISAAEFAELSGKVAERLDEVLESYG